MQYDDILGGQGDWGQAKILQETVEPAGLVRQQRQPRSFGALRCGENADFVRQAFRPFAHKGKKGLGDHLRGQSGD